MRLKCCYVFDFLRLTMLLQMFLFFWHFEPQRCYKEGCYSAKCVHSCFKSRACASISHNGKSFEFVFSWKYLGVKVTSEKNFCCPVVVQSPYWTSLILPVNKFKWNFFTLYYVFVPHLTCDVVDYRVNNLKWGKANFS